MEKKKKKWLSLFLAVILAFTGLPVSLMAAGNAKSQTQETTKILPSQTSGEINCFSYESFSGKSWTYNDDEAYIDLGSSNEKAEECFYRVTFKGNAIEVFANKSHNHGKVKYRVDDGAETLVDPAVPRRSLYIKQKTLRKVNIRSMQLRRRNAVAVR